MAIIAALSVLYWSFGIYTFQFILSANIVTSFLNPELAETPPAIAISVIPVSFTARLSLLSRIAIIVRWMEAERSALFFSIKFDSYRAHIFFGIYSSHY